MSQNVLMSQCLCRLTILLLVWTHAGMAVERTADFPAAKSKVLHFPRDQFLGNLFLEDPHLGSHYLELGRDLSLPLGLDSERVAMGGDWDFLALAQGDVAVPAEGNIKLSVGLEPQPEDFRRMSELSRYAYQHGSRKGPNDLSGLLALGPEDLYRLDVSAFVRRSDADRRVLEPISHLTGLEILSLVDTGITNRQAPLLKSLSSLRALKLQRELSLGNAGLAVLQDLPALEYLDLWTGATDAGFKHLRHLPSLRWLRVRMGRLHGPGLANLATLPRLERLSLWGESGLTDRHLRYLEGCSQLKALTLWGENYRFTDQALVSIGKLVALEELIFIRARTDFTDAGIAHLKNLPHLRKLRLFYAELSDTSVRMLIDMPHLDTLTGVSLTREAIAELETWPRPRELRVNLVHREGNTDPTPFAHLGALHSLERLHTEGFDSELAYLENLRNLKDLSISGESITDRGLASVGHLRSLEHLTLSNWDSGFTKEGLNQLSSLTHLQTLDVSNYGQIPSKEQMSPLDLSSLTNLKTLVLQGRSLDKSDLRFLSKLHQLEWLILENGPIDEGVFEYLGCLTQLKHLFVLGLTFSTGDSLAYLEGLPKLESLRLHGNFDDQILRHLTGLPSLRQLHIETPTTIRPATRIFLQENLPVIQSIRIVSPGQMPESILPTTQKKRRERISPTGRRIRQGQRRSRSR